MRKGAEQENSSMVRRVLAQPRNSIYVKEGEAEIAKPKAA
jgi:hypothetical protein